MNYYYENILKATDYIEKNLTNNMNLSEIISCTGFSKFHFARIFKAISGYTITDYMRRRRITEAAKLLTNTNMRIIDIAVLYGYNSQEAFTRAFKEVFNVTPNNYRVKKLSLDNLNQLVLSEDLLNLKIEKESIEPIIVEKDSFLIAGLEYEGQNNNFQIPKLWNSFCENMISIEHLINKEVFYGLERYNEISGQDFCFKYLAGAEIAQCDDRIKKNMKIAKIERSKYAVFPIKAIIEEVPKTISKIYSVYLPKTALRIKGNYDFEYYDNSFKPNKNDALLYFYVPIED